MNYSRTSDWLADLDSHTLYSVEMLEQIPGVTVEPGTASDTGAVLRRADGRGTPVRVSLQTLGEVAANPGRTGVTLNPDHDSSELAFAGFHLASRLAILFLGSSPGAAKGGRGFAFRADLEALRAAGF